jgi:Protein of unknown function (DUF3990)
MPWRHYLFLYHGTVAPFADDICKQVNLTHAKPKRDFGRGFYTTRIRQQAHRFAQIAYRNALFDYQQGKSSVDPVAAAIVEFQINLDALAALESLAFVQATEDWRNFTTYCRNTGGFHRSNSKNYHVVYGPVRSIRGAIRGYEQISFHDDYGISLLNVIGVDKWVPQ